MYRSCGTDRRLRRDALLGTLHLYHRHRFCLLLRARPFRIDREADDKYKRALQAMFATAKEAIHTLEHIDEIQDQVAGKA